MASKSNMCFLLPVLLAFARASELCDAGDLQRCGTGRERERESQLRRSQHRERERERQRERERERGRDTKKGIDRPERIAEQQGSRTERAHMQQRVEGPNSCVLVLLRWGAAYVAPYWGNFRWGRGQNTRRLQVDLGVGACPDHGLIYAASFTPTENRGRLADWKRKKRRERDRERESLFGL